MDATRPGSAVLQAGALLGLPVCPALGSHGMLHALPAALSSETLGGRLVSDFRTAGLPRARKKGVWRRTAGGRAVQGPSFLGR